MVVISLSIQHLSKASRNVLQRKKKNIFTGNNKTKTRLKQD